MEMSKSGNQKVKCGGCASPTQQQTQSAQISHGGGSMQSLLFADEEKCQCEDDSCFECSEDLNDHHHCSAYSAAEERDSLLPEVGEQNYHGTPARMHLRMSASPTDPMKSCHHETISNCGRTPLSSDEVHGIAKDSKHDFSRECSGDHPEALPALSTLQCPSAMMSSTFLPSSINARHLNASHPSRPTSQPPTSEPFSRDHSTPVASNHLPIFCNDNPHPIRGDGSPSGEDVEECFVIVNEGNLEEFCQSVYSRMEHCLQQNVQAAGPKGISPISMTSLGSLSSGDGPLCRICHEGPTSNEDMLAPCHCSGTLTYQHRRCLEQWLQTRGKDACELCNFRFTTQRKGRPFSEWIRQPERIRDRRNILTDCSCFALLTPLVCVSTWLCLNGAYHYLSFYEGRGWESIGLIALASVLIFIYLFWSLMSMRYHCIVWRTWRKEHQRVHIVMDPKDSENNNNDISIGSSKGSRLPGSCTPGVTPGVTPSCTRSVKGSGTPSLKSIGSLSPSWASPDSYKITLEAPLASMTSL